MSDPNPEAVPAVQPEAETVPAVPTVSTAPTVPAVPRVVEPVPSRRKDDSFFVKFLRFSSTACAIAGGTMLASNTAVSKYGFVLLAMSSGQMLLSSAIVGNKSLIIYSAALFVFVDCLGIYRWVLQ